MKPLKSRHFHYSIQCWLNPLYQYANSPYCSLYLSHGSYKENLSNNQEFLKFVITFFILMTLMCDSGMILLGDIRCLSLLQLKGLFHWGLFKYGSYLIQHIIFFVLWLTAIFLVVIVSSEIQEVICYSHFKSLDYKLTFLWFRQSKC